MQISPGHVLASQTPLMADKDGIPVPHTKDKAQLREEIAALELECAKRRELLEAIEKEEMKQLTQAEAAKQAVKFREFARQRITEYRHSAVTHLVIMWENLSCYLDNTARGPVGPLIVAYLTNGAVLALGATEMRGKDTKLDVKMVFHANGKRTPPPEYKLPGSPPKYHLCPTKAHPAPNTEERFHFYSVCPHALLEDISRFIRTMLLDAMCCDAPEHSIFFWVVDDVPRPIGTTTSYYVL